MWDRRLTIEGDADERSWSSSSGLTHGPARSVPYVLVLGLVGCAPRSDDLLGRSYIGGAAETALLDPHRYLSDTIVHLTPYREGAPRTGAAGTGVDLRNDHKLRVELPWPNAGFVVLDFPEALRAGRSWLFRANTDARDRTARQFTALPNVGWKIHRDGRMNYYRKLPGGVAFSALAIPRRGYVDLAFTVINRSAADLTHLRAPMCAMLGYAPDFAARSRGNKYCVVADRVVPVATAMQRPSGAGRYGLPFSESTHRVDAPVIAARAKGDGRWTVTVWQPCLALRAGTVNPCIHSDPKLADCPRGDQVTVRGRLYFVEGDIDAFYKGLRAQGADFMPPLENRP